MGEQRNLTEENVEELKKQLENMKQTNPELEYRFFPQDNEPQEQEDTGDTEDTISIVREIREKVDALDRKISLIFDGHVLMDGKFRKV